MPDKNKCGLCKSNKLEIIVSAGEQPLANKFLKSPEEQEYTHPKDLGVCINCGLVQLIAPVCFKELTARFDWIRYNEPEDHLDDLANKIASLKDISQESVIGAISFKDASLQKRLSNLGFSTNWIIDPKKHLDINNQSAGIETIQFKLPVAINEKRLADLKKADVILIRHILEHAHDINCFVAAIKKLINTTGYLIFEVPCCDDHLKELDYSMIWEDHISYFTPATFRNFFDYTGLTLIHFERFHYKLEDTLIGIATIKTISTPYLEKCQEKSLAVIKDEINRAAQYGASFKSYSLKLNSYLSEITKNNGKIVLFGAGHMATTFINIFDIGRFIEVIVDDEPNKTDLFLPGSRLPIKTVQSLINKNFKVCLLAVNPAVEKRIIPKLATFLDKNGIIISIFPSSKYAWNHHLPQLAL